MRHKFKEVHLKSSSFHKPPREVLDQLVFFYNKKNYLFVIEQAQILLENYSKEYSIWNILGAAATQIGDSKKAIDAFKNVILLKPDFVEAYSNLGVALYNLGMLQEAINSYKKAISIKPDYANAHYNMGRAFKQIGRFNDSIKAFNDSLSIKPDYVDAYCNMGVILHEQGKLDKAIEVYIKALSIKPDYAEVYCNLGNVLRDKFKLKDSIKMYYKAISIKPDFAEALCNIGVSLHDLGKYSDAIIAFRKTISLNPNYAEAHLCLSYVLLNSGILKEGLNEFEWRWKTSNLIKQQRYFLQSLWDKKKYMHGKRILLWSEQGIAETINWSSYLSFINSKDEHFILECQEKLVPLFKRSFPNIKIKKENRDLDLKREDFDFHLPLGSLYKQFFYEISQNVRPKPFLFPDQLRVNFWKQRLKSLGHGPFIGICWKSSNITSTRQPNYAKISDLYPVLKLPNVTFINLQNSEFKDDLTKTYSEIGIKIHNFDDLNQYDDLDDVASLCSALDVVISIKTTVAFIAAGVGTITKLANWRQSSWNNLLFNPSGPLVKIFERNTEDSWENIYHLIAEDILKYKNKK